MTQLLTPEKAAELLKELQYAKAEMGQLSIRDEYFKQALEQLVLARVNVEDVLFKEECLGNSHNWRVIAGYYISSGFPGKSNTVEGYSVCEKCGLTKPLSTKSEKQL